MRKKFVTVLACIILVPVLLLTALCIYHQIRLKKERSIINHTLGQFVEVDGHNMNIYTEGSGNKTLVFLSGFGTPSPILDFKPLYSRLSDKYRIVVIEKFGYGYSDEYEGDRSVDTIVDQNRRALEVLGIGGPYILVAHSAGGIEAIWWAEHYPDEVEAITELRKRSGLSQEQFGDKIGVSRQAVSKWEMSQTTPDLNKIMAVAEFFGVSTDFLLKDELDMSDLDFCGVAPAASEVSKSAGQTVSLEEVQAFLAATRSKTRGFIIAIILLFLSPIPGIFLSLGKSNNLPVAGTMIQILLLIVAAVILILAVNKTSSFTFLKSSDAELAYGVRGVVEEYKRDFDHTHLLGIIIGVILLIASVLPMMVCSFFTDTKDTLIVLCAVIMLLMFASGICSIVYVCVINNSFKRILKIS